jgi:hypothetical protein
MDQASHLAVKTLCVQRTQSLQQRGMLLGLWHAVQVVRVLPKINERASLRIVRRRPWDDQHRIVLAAFN